MKLPKLSGIPDLSIPTEQPNAGGISKLRIVPASQVKLTLPERFAPAALHGYDSQTISAQHLTFEADTSIIDIYVMPEYCSFSDLSEQTANGLLFKPLVQVIIPKVRQDVVTWVNNYKDVRWLAFLQDRNGLCRLVGLPEQPLTIGVSFGQEMGKGRNQTILTFMGETQRPALVLTGIEDADLLYAGPFDVAFGFGYDS